MAKVDLNKSLEASSILWRYIPLDKLIHLFETESLFFTPLPNYNETDPFEGYMPKVVFEAIGKAAQPRLEDIETKVIETVAKKEILEGKFGRNVNADRIIDDFKTKQDDPSELFKELYLGIIRNITVCCWHQNKVESEAMWKLYSDQGKGVAIKTSVQSLTNSIECFDEPINLSMGAVKYLDFIDSELSPSDCDVDGHMVPLLKRSAFSHENEVRLFHLKKLDTQNIEKNQPEPLFIKVDPHLLVEEIYISPFATEPFISSTIAICKKYGMPHDRIIKSSLLTGHKELLESVFPKND